MQASLLKQFQTQVIDQCRIILLEDKEIERALELCRVSPIGNDLVWAHLQNLLNAAANVAKALYGSRGRKKDERAELRKTLGIEGDDIFWGVAMRNNFEHIDERLDRWSSESIDRSFVDKQIGPAHLVSHVDAIGLFRFFDPETWIVGFWGERFDVRAVVAEAGRLMPPIDDDDYYGPTRPEGWDVIIAAWGQRLSRRRGVQ